MRKSLLIFALMLLPLAAGAVEKTAIDKRLNAPLDVDLEGLQVFLTVLTGRIDVDLGNKITIWTGVTNDYTTIIQQLTQRIEVLVPQYDVCVHATKDVPSNYDVTKNRLTWYGSAWGSIALQHWETPTPANGGN